VTDGGVDQHLPFPPAPSIRRAIAELRHPRPLDALNERVVSLHDHT
jgi:hypothetical protein